MHQSLAFAPLAAAPFEPNGELVEQGASYFRTLGCASCHSLGDGATAAGATPLAELDPNARHGCLEREARPAVPRYSLTSEDRKALRETLSNSEDLAKPLGPSDHVQYTLARFECFGCHSRGGVGGPHPERKEHFRVIGDADLGDQGRFPPHLEFVGAKLRRRWVDAVMFENAGQRPYMATRMPQFGRDNIGHLPALFELLDGSPVADPEPKFNGELLEAGRALVGTKGWDASSATSSASTLRSACQRSI